ncbi:MAG: 16S rRNA (guanine(966)-N(2))-methyltransferase RsmD [Burkholderiaceae bacterium]
MASVDDRSRRRLRQRADDKRERRPPSAPQRVRIVGGRWKRTPLPVPDVPGLRPTPDRVRETLFNWLGASVEGATVLDLFAGTGALGFEAASRGAQRVTMVEADPIAWRSLLRVRERLHGEQVEIVRDDAHRWLEKAAASGLRFDLILLDPPFGRGWIAAVMARIRPLVAAAGRVYVEAEAPWPATPYLLPGSSGRPAPAQSGRAASHAPGDGTLVGEHLAIADWQVIRAARAGQVHYHLLEPAQLAGANHEDDARWSLPFIPEPSTR